MSDPRQRPAPDEPHDRYEKVTTTDRPEDHEQSIGHSFSTLSGPTISRRAVAVAAPNSPPTLRRTSRLAESSGHKHQRSRSSRDSGSPESPPNLPHQGSEPPPIHSDVHPAVHISRETGAAIQFALEEALRTHHPFTSDLVEERAQMSDLGLGSSNVRASDGNTRPPGTSQSPHAGVRTPRDIMKDRNEREARRRAAAEQTQRQQEEDRRRSAERRIAATAAGAAPIATQRPLSGYETTIPPSQGSSMLASATANPPSSYSAAYASRNPTDPPRPIGRPRGVPRPVEDPEPPTAQPSLRRPAEPVTGATTSSSAPAREQQRPNAAQQRNNNTSTFPHAFERWEQLSSHWEGLTSYWLHKLETNQEAIAKTVPTALAMSRQITDLSAAGANLFHAVVELQRLRASSERKFQRWFMETRAEQEKDRESRVELDRALQVERDARDELSREREKAESERRQAEAMTKEMRRELSISKEEARRAWEELGRREEEERERTNSLKQGLPTVVGGVQVVPMHASPDISRQGSQSQHPQRGVVYPTSQTTSHDIYSQQGPEYIEGDDEEQRANTAEDDYFTESGPSGRSGAGLRHEPEISSLSGRQQHNPYQRSTPATSGSVQTAIPSSSRGAPAASADVASHGRRAPAMEEEEEAPEHFYQRPARTASAEAGPSTARDTRSPASYMSSEGTTYEIDSQGNIQRDLEGRPIFLSGGRPGSPQSRSEQSGHRRATSGSAAGQSAAIRSPSTGSESSHRDPSYRRPVAHHSAEAMAGLAAPSPPVALPLGSHPADGAGYVYGPAGEIYEVLPGGRLLTTSGSPVPAETVQQMQSTGAVTAGGWETLQTRHHHPTRLSDVIEEEEGSARGSRVI